MDPEALSALLAHDRYLSSVLDRLKRSVSLAVNLSQIEMHLDNSEKVMNGIGDTALTLLGRQTGNAEFLVFTMLHVLEKELIND